MNFVLNLLILLAIVEVARAVVRIAATRRHLCAEELREYAHRSTRRAGRARRRITTHLGRCELCQSRLHHFLRFGEHDPLDHLG